MLKSTYNSDTPGHPGSVAMTLFCPSAGTCGIDHPGGRFWRHLCVPLRMKRMIS